MEGKGVNDSGCNGVRGDEDPGRFEVGPSSENPGPLIGSSGATPLSDSTQMKKKRGRPKKYGPDGSVRLALSPMPISASIPLTAQSDYSSFKKKHKFNLQNHGERMAYSVGANFTPHVITVNAGEDVTMKIMSFAQQGSRAICVLAANGAISNVTLRQPNSSGGTLTYEGRFEILSLTGSFMPSDNGVTKSRSGGMSVSLSGPDGRVLGGGLAGMLVAAGPVQVVVGSFLSGHQLEPKPKKPRFEHTSSIRNLGSSNPVTDERSEGAHSGQTPNLTSSATFHGDNLTSANSIHGSRISVIGNNSIPLSREELQAPSPSKCEVSC